MATKDDNNMEPMDALKEYDINLEQEMFCQYYTSATEFFGNGVQSYAAAYNFDLTDRRQYQTAKNAAARLLTNPKVLRRINDLINAQGLNDANVDKQLFFLLTQNADFNAKLGAIREYNKLKQRITDKMEHTFANPVSVIEIVPAPKKKQNESDNSGTTDGS